jgi:integrase/recombinase XerD
VPAQKRPFTKAELQRLFHYIDDLIDHEYEAGSKRWLPLFRDSVAFKVCYAYGLRRREMTMLDLEDFGPNPHVQDYGRFGALQVRFAKGTAGSGPQAAHCSDCPRVRLGR